MALYTIKRPIVIGGKGIAYDIVDVTPNWFYQKLQYFNRSFGSLYKGEGNIY